MDPNRAMHEEILIYLLQNQTRLPIDTSVMAEDFSGARQNPLAMRDMVRGVGQEETAAHQAMQKRLEGFLGEMEERGLVEMTGSLMVATRRARLTPAGRRRAETALEGRMKRELR